MTREQKLEMGLDGLLQWVLAAHKGDGWNSLSTPTAVVVACAALSDANIPAFGKSKAAQVADAIARAAGLPVAAEEQVRSSEAASHHPSPTASKGVLK